MLKSYAENDSVAARRLCHQTQPLLPGVFHDFIPIGGETL
jgi:hypothetical protein